MTNNNLLGRPEWADEEEAGEAVEALGLGLDTGKTQPTASAPNRAQWSASAAFYWAQSWVALTERDFRLMRSSAAQAEEAEYRCSPEAALLAAIFDTRGAPSERTVEIGMKLPSDQVAAAKAAVKAEIARFHTSRKSRVR